MTTVEASAPGKALLCGEYAVLAGAPAIVVALDRRATVVISATRNEWHQFDAPGISDRRWKFSVDSSHNILWHDADAERLFGLFSSVWRVMKPDPETGLSITIDSRQLYDPDSGAKIGIGSSAAVATSLVTALDSLSPVDGDPYTLVQQAQRAFQGGRGSGVDVAASYYGGAVVFASGAAPVQTRWPDGLCCRFLWSGIAADTTARLEKLDARSLVANPPGSARLLAASAAQVAESWVAGNAAEILHDIGEYSTSLMAFADELDLDVFGAGHQEISDLASQCGIVYKPCGAGGGDIGVALASDANALASFCNRSVDKGFSPLDVEVDARGVTTNIKELHGE